MLAIQFLYLNIISTYLVIFHAPTRHSIWNICPIKEFQIFHFSVNVILTSYTKNKFNLTSRIQNIKQEKIHNVNKNKQIISQEIYPLKKLDQHHGQGDLCPNDS